MGKCQLCHADADLRNSHIIPEWCYKPLYDENPRRLHELSTDASTPNKAFRQKGLREQLLCASCEQHFGVFENYARKVIYGGVPIEIDQSHGVLNLKGLDYRLLKAFQLSILWRSSVTRLPFFAQVSLGPHEERIRQRLLSGDVGCWLDYPCAMASIVTSTGQPRDKIGVVDGAILNPDRSKIEGHHCYRFVFTGVVWVFIVSSHTASFPFKESFLTEQGELSVPLKKVEETELFTGLARRLSQAGKLK